MNDKSPAAAAAEPEQITPDKGLMALECNKEKSCSTTEYEFAFLHVHK